MIYRPCPVLLPKSHILVSAMNSLERDTLRPSEGHSTSPARTRDPTRVIAQDEGPWIQVPKEQYRLCTPVVKDTVIMSLAQPPAAS